jgi:hypothetical protein
MMTAQDIDGLADQIANSLSELRRLTKQRIESLETENATLRSLLTETVDMSKPEHGVTKPPAGVTQPELPQPDCSMVGWAEMEKRIREAVAAERERTAADKEYLTRAGLANEWEERFRIQAEQILSRDLEIARLNGAWCDVRSQKDALRAERDALRAEVERLRNAIRNQRGDDLCWIQNPENAEVAKVLPEAEFLESCRRFHGQLAAERGTFAGGMTIAQLEAEIERLKKLKLTSALEFEFEMQDLERRAQEAEAERDSLKQRAETLERLFMPNDHPAVPCPECAGTRIKPEDALHASSEYPPSYCCPIGHAKECKCVLCQWRRSYFQKARALEAMKQRAEQAEAGCAEMLLALEQIATYCEQTRERADDRAPDPDWPAILLGLEKIARKSLDAPESRLNPPRTDEPEPGQNGEPNL